MTVPPTNTRGQAQARRQFSGGLLGDDFRVAVPETLPLLRLAKPPMSGLSPRVSQEMRLLPINATSTRKILPPLQLGVFPPCLEPAVRATPPGCISPGTVRLVQVLRSDPDSCRPSESERCRLPPVSSTWSILSLLSPVAVSTKMLLVANMGLCQRLFFLRKRGVSTNIHPFFNPALLQARTSPKIQLNWTSVTWLLRFGKVEDDGRLNFAARNPGDLYLLLPLRLLPFLSLRHHCQSFEHHFEQVSDQHHSFAERFQRDTFLRKSTLTISQPSTPETPINKPKLSRQNALNNRYWRSRAARLGLFSYGRICHHCQQLWLPHLLRICWPEPRRRYAGNPRQLHRELW